MKMHEALIERGHVCTIRDIFTIKGIVDFKLIRMTGDDGQELKPYEAMAGRPLTRYDAIVISQFTETEIQDLIEDAMYDEALQALWSERTKEGIRHYNIHYSSDDPICAETVDYAIPDGIDTSSSFDGGYDGLYDRIIRDALWDSVSKVAWWLCEEKEDFLEFRSINNHYIGSGIIRNDVMIREMKTKDVVVILERDRSEQNEAGFLILTAYPDITDRAETAVPTGRDLRPDLHESNSYKYGSAAEKRLLDQKALNGLTH